VGQGKQPETSSAPEGPDIICYSASDRIAAIIMAGLVQCNYRAEFANSSYLAIIKAAQLLPRLVVVDINNPGQKGFRLLRRFANRYAPSTFPLSSCFRGSGHLA